ncbi:response regulator [Marinimicrococcus flavescens]|uniref:Response regulator n=1 Tax=Marinimicrococcus flavescens TaxID=3031815 RepID=A0AAP3XR16_9PROT|nr:response regulator [Marinimicrococcus flavescens]
MKAAADVTNEEVGTALLAGLSILLVEDEFLIALDLCEMLEAAGAQVVGPAYRAEEALALLEAQRIDMAVLDVDLGDHGAEPVALRMEERQVPFLFHTGRGLPPHLRERFEGVPLLVKPAPRQLLIGAVRALVP